MIKLVSWNVNGIRSALGKGFDQAVRDLDADVICLQEVRANPEQVTVELPGYEMIWNPAQKKGYSGTGLLTRIGLRSVTRGLQIDGEDLEGRVVTAELDDCYLVSVYTPNAGRGLVRLDYRTKVWDPAFLGHVKKLQKRKPVIFCGDLNVAHREIDLANPKQNRKNAGFTDEERAGFDAVVEAGFLDTFREFHPEGGNYTWWSNFGKSRERNIGWRIDYFCISPKLRPRLVGAQIHPQIFGSDHCPVSIVID